MKLIGPVILRIHGTLRVMVPANKDTYYTSESVRTLVTAIEVAQKQGIKVKLVG